MNDVKSDHDNSLVIQKLRAFHREVFGDYHHKGVLQVQTGTHKGVDLEDLRQSIKGVPKKFWNIQAGLREGNAFLEFLSGLKSQAVGIYNSRIHELNLVRDYINRWYQPLQTAATLNREQRRKLTENPKAYVREIGDCSKRGCLGPVYKDGLCEGHFLREAQNKATNAE